VSGTTGYDYSRMSIDPSAVVQAEQCFFNIAEALVKAGSHIDRVFRIRVHLASIGYQQLDLNIHFESSRFFLAPLALYS